MQSCRTEDRESCSLAGSLDHFPHLETRYPRRQKQNGNGNGVSLNSKDQLKTASHPGDILAESTLLPRRTVRSSSVNGHSSSLPRNSSDVMKNSEML